MRSRESIKNFCDLPSISTVKNNFGPERIWVIGMTTGFEGSPAGVLLSNLFSLDALVPPVSVVRVFVKGFVVCAIGTNESPRRWNFDFSHNRSWPQNIWAQYFFLSLFFSVSASHWLSTLERSDLVCYNYNSSVPSGEHRS
jgi:hypothetical protein